MTAYSVLVPFIPRRPEQLLTYAALVDWTNADRLWQGQSLLIEPFQGFATAAGSGFRIPTGVGVTLMPLRHPFEAAHQARSLALATGESVTAGFGPGGVSFQRSILGAPYRSQLGAVREYATIVRGLLDGRVVELDGEHFSCHAGMEPSVAPPVHLGLGVLRPGMARLAGELADVAITWLTPPAYLRDTLVPALREGAARSGRPVPRLAAMVPLAVRRPDLEAADMVLASNATHMRAPHYVDMLRRAGVDVTGDDARLDAKRMAEAGCFLHGDLAELQEGLRSYQDAGVDELILNVTGVFNVHGPRVAMDELKTLLAAVAS